MSTRIGIVGLPNAGKSSLFNALTKAGAQTANYPFTTIDPNVAVVPIPDQRLEQVAQTLGASEIVYDTVDFHDIAGLIAGAHKGEGLGNKFLSHIRETHAIVHVVRVHDDGSVIHPEGRVDPLADIETIETELALADLEQAERRLQRAQRQAKGGSREAQAEVEWLQAVIGALGEGRPARELDVPEEAAVAARSLGLITGKPVLFVANIQEGSSELPADLLAAAKERSAAIVAISARAESELAELDDQEAQELRTELGLGDERSLDRLLRAAFELLGLIAFFTAGEAKPAQSWHLKQGASAYAAAGAIHSDIQKGFVRAEVISWRDLVDAGGYAGARDRGTLRLEGRDYLLHDGDVITVKFTP